MTSSGGMAGGADAGGVVVDGADASGAVVGSADAGGAVGGADLTSSGAIDGGADASGAVVGSALPDDPLVMEAFERATNGMDAETLSGLSNEQLEGVLGATKGHYFESLVVDRLNKGEQVGELQLDEGQTAVLAESQNQPDWDLQILNKDGTTDEVLQLKATESMRPVSEALRDNPDITVLTTSDIDSPGEDVLSTDISNADLKEDVSSQLGAYSSGDNSEAAGGSAVDGGDVSSASAGGAGDGGGAAAGGGDAGGAAAGGGASSDDEAVNFATMPQSDGFETLEVASELAFDAIPVVSGVFIVAIEGRRVITGSAQLEEALARGSKRLGTAAVFTTAGAAMTAAGAPGVVVIPPLLAARVILSRYGNRATMGEFVKEHGDTLTALTPQTATN